MLSCFSHVWLFGTPWTAARQAPLSMGFSRQEYCSSCHALLQGTCSQPLDRQWNSEKRNCWPRTAEWASSKAGRNSASQSVVKHSFYYTIPKTGGQRARSTGQAHPRSHIQTTPTYHDSLLSVFKSFKWRGNTGHSRLCKKPRRDWPSASEKEHIHTIGHSWLREA